MPELPEVETVVRGLRDPLIGQTFVGVCCDWPRHIQGLSVTALQERLHGRSVQAITRRGKYLLIQLHDGQVLVIHLRMSGRLSVVAAETPTDKHTHTRFLLADGRELRFWDQRKFGRVYLVEDAAEVVHKLGPEPLSSAFTVEVLHGLVNGRKRPIKSLLLDQTLIAGIGNIYADEALFYARIHPTRPAHRLTQEEIGRLHAGIRQALQLGISRGGATLQLFIHPDGRSGDMQKALRVFRRTGLLCYDCGTPIAKIVLGGRSTHFCPQCQV